MIDSLGKIGLALEFLVAGLGKKISSVGQSRNISAESSSLKRRSAKVNNGPAK